jgi:uncharacterized phiE125 gp8 family phage protein
MNAQKTIQVVTPPASEPLTLAEVKEFLRVDHSDDDATLAIFITAARQLCESYTRLALLPTTFEEYFDDFPQYSGTYKDEIRLSRSPVSAVTYVKYIDGNETTITASASDYKTDLISQPARISPDNGWFGTYETINAVFIRYVAGYANAASVPAPLKHGMLLVIGDMYENRTDSVKRLPTAAEYLWNPYRVFSF